MPWATSPSALASTSTGCMPQNSAIWVNVSAVFSISHTAVAFGIRGRVMGLPSPLGRRPAAPGGSTKWDRRIWDRGRRRVKGCQRCYAAYFAGQASRRLDLPLRRGRMLNHDEERRPRPRFVPPPLDRLGVEELQAYIDELRAEI